VYRELERGLKPAFDEVTRRERSWDKLGQENATVSPPQQCSLRVKS
jgi:hypothetical protein